MRNNRILVLVECALAVALSLVLNFIAIRLPINIAGGSVSLTMLPIAIVALRRGPAAGALTGVVFGTFDLLMEPFIIHWAQVILDYPLPYLLFGFGVGLFARVYARTYEKSSQSTIKNKLGKGSVLIAFALVLGGALRYAAHVSSGVIFFAEYAGGENVLLYSLVYNISYLAPSLVATFVLALVIMPILARAVPIKS